MAKIKILRILHRPTISGPTHHAIILQEYFNNERYKSKLITGTPIASEESAQHFFDEKCISFEQLSFSRGFNLLKDLKSIFYLIRIIKSFQPDIIHTHASKPGIYGRILGKLLGVKVLIHTFHGHVFHSYFSSFISFFIIQIERLLARYFSTKIICISKSQFDEITNYIGNKKKATIIQLGLELDKYLILNNNFQGLFKRQNGFEGFKVVGIIGRLTEIKNHKYFIELANYLIPKNPNLMFCIAGDGELKEELLSFIMNFPNLNNRIKFIGWVENVSDFYSGIDWLFLTSKNEGTPVCIIEAISCGVQVYATDVGGVRDIFEICNTGNILPDNFEDADHILKNVIENNGERISFESRKKAIKHYGKSKLVTSLDNLYLECIESN